MNQHDDGLLEQLNRALEQGGTSDNLTVNRLASTQPQMDAAYQAALEARLMAKFHAPPTPSQVILQAQKEHTTMQMVAAIPISEGLQPTSLKRPTQLAKSRSFLTWAAAVIAVLLVGGLMFSLSGGGNLPALTSLAALTATPTQPAAVPVITITPSPIPQPVAEVSIQLVIATRDIVRGTVITDEMIGVVSLSAADFAEFEVAQADGVYFTETSQVVGQVATLNIRWFEPIALRWVSESAVVCAETGTYCIEIPEGYDTIGLPGDMRMVQGLTIGDRVDVFAAVDGELQTIVEDVLLVDVSRDTLVLAAPSWKHGILIWLYQAYQSYSLRLSTETDPVPADMTIGDYTFTSPEPLPDDYQFDLIVGLTDAEGYKLVDLPAPIDHIQFTEYDTRLQFWFKDIEVVSLEDGGTTVTVRIPRADAQNLDYLMSIGASLTFVPDAG